MKVSTYHKTGQMTKTTKNLLPLVTAGVALGGIVAYCTNKGFAQAPEAWDDFVVFGFVRA